MSTRVNTPRHGRSASMENFLSQTRIRQGILDAYFDAKFKHYYNDSCAITYERGRHIGSYAKSKRYQVRHLYDGFLDCKGEPTQKLISLACEMLRHNLFV